MGGREGGWTEQEKLEASVPESPTGASHVRMGRESRIECENGGYRCYIVSTTP